MSALRRSARIASMNSKKAPETPKKVPKDTCVPEAPKKQNRPLATVLMGRYDILRELEEAVTWLEELDHQQLETRPQLYETVEQLFSDLANDIRIVTTLMTVFKDEIRTRKNIMAVVDDEELTPTYFDVEQARRYRDIMRKEEWRRIADLEQLLYYSRDLLFRLDECMGYFSRQEMTDDLTIIYKAMYDEAQ